MTSGATGEPKMGIVSHWAVGANLDMGPHVLPLGPDDSTVVFLPSAHIAQRVVAQFLPMRCGTPVYFSEGLTRLPMDYVASSQRSSWRRREFGRRMYASISTEIKKRPPSCGAFFIWLLESACGQAGFDRRTSRFPPGWNVPSAR